jgi:hypothetical protein
MFTSFLATQACTIPSLEAQGFIGEDVAALELGHRSYKGTLASLEAQGFTGEGVAASEQGCQRRKGALASLEVQGFTEEGVAALEFGHRGHKGNLASLEVQRLMREEATSEQGEMAILFCWQFVLLFVLPALVTFCQFVWGRTFW